MDYKFKLTLLKNKEKIFGNGPLKLLKYIDKYKSIKKASEKMNMSYNKAYLIIKNLENSLNLKLVNRYKGGITRGGAELSEKGKQIVRDFENINKEIKKFIDKQIKKYFIL